MTSLARITRFCAAFGGVVVTFFGEKSCEERCSSRSSKYFYQEESQSSVRVLSLVSLLVLTACGPISPERAAKLCEDRARAATGPTGKVGIGISNNGPSGFVGIGVSSDYLLGRDPLVVYEDCVRQKTGEAPFRAPVL